ILKEPQMTKEKVIKEVGINKIIGYSRIKVDKERLLIEVIYNTIIIQIDYNFNRENDKINVMIYSENENDSRMILKSLYFVLKGSKYNQILNVDVDDVVCEFVPLDVIIHKYDFQLARDKYFKVRKENKEKLLFGLELEVYEPEYYGTVVQYREGYDRNYYLFAYAIDSLKRKHNLIFQRDGSVLFGELKTLPVTYEEAKNVLEDFEKIRTRFKNYFTGSKSLKAGLHIHFSKLSHQMDDRVYYISTRLFYELDYDIINKFFGRGSNSYCQIITDRSERYRFINHTNDETIELRLPTTSLNCKNLVDVLDFTKLLAELALDTSKTIDQAVDELFKFISSKVEENVNVNELANVS
ncbi:MAG: hypothetical protein QW806_10320, partial [Nitrososphaerota archaeon]